MIGLVSRRVDAALRALAASMPKELRAELGERSPIFGPTDALDSLGVAIVFDRDSLLRARRAGVPQVIAALPGYDDAFGEAIGEADVALVTSHEQAQALPEGRRVVVGAVAPTGFDSTLPAVPEDVAGEEAAKRADDARDAHARNLGLHERVVVVPVQILDALGPTPVLVQLGLAAPPVSFVFDVGLDVEAAEALRRIVPEHGLDAALVACDPADPAATPAAPAIYGAADLVLALPRSPVAEFALAAGAGVVALVDKDDPREARWGESLRRQGVGLVCRGLPSLAVAIDEGLSRAADLAQAVRDLDVPGSRARFWAAVSERASERPRPRGLPRGVEKLPSEPLAPEERRPRAAAKAATGGESSIEERLARLEPEAAREDLEQRIDDELAALKARIAKSED